MRFFKSTVVAAGINIIFLANALAMTGLDFIKLENATSQRKALEPIIIQFATNGYKNVPDWPSLSIKVREIILKSGYGSQPLERITKEAAKQLGMSR